MWLWFESQLMFCTCAIEHSLIFGKFFIFLIIILYWNIICSAVLAMKLKDAYSLEGKLWPT